MALMGLLVDDIPEEGISELEGLSSVAIPKCTFQRTKTEKQKRLPMRL